MTEYFVFSNSFAAPFVSDKQESFVSGNSPREALEQYVENYRHPAGLYFAALYASSDDFHKHHEPLVKWTCNHEIAKQKATEKLNVYTLESHGPGTFYVDDKLIRVAQPKAGEFQGA